MFRAFTEGTESNYDEEGLQLKDIREDDRKGPGTFNAWSKL